MKKYAFGADIGGTTVKLGLFTVEGELLDKWEIPTRTGGEYDILQDVADSCREKMEQKGLSADTFAASVSVCRDGAGGRFCGCLR